MNSLHFISPMQSNQAQDANNNNRDPKCIIMTTPTGHRSFKERWSLGIRMQESKSVMQKFPRKLPVIVEKYAKEFCLPYLDRTKFLIPEEWKMSQVAATVRNRMKLKSSQAFYLMVNNKSITSLSHTVSEVYWHHKDVDGFLYITYAAEEMYGGPLPNPEEHLDNGW